VDPVEVELVASLAAGDPAPRTVTILPASRRYATSIDYKTTPPAAWLTAALSGDGSEVVVTCSLAGLAPGSYRATVWVSRRGAATSFSVLLTVTL
jgi:hypothetical protein